VYQWSLAGCAVLRTLGQKPQPHILRGVGILVLINEYISELGVILPQHVRMFAENTDAQHQQAAEICCVQRLQPIVIGSVEQTALAVAECPRITLRDFSRRQPLVLPAVDKPCHLPSGPALVIQAFCLDKLLDQSDLVISVEDREVRRKADQFRMPAQELDANRVKRAEPW